MYSGRLRSWMVDELREVIGASEYEVGQSA
jgi:hypothetical protein